MSDDARSVQLRQRQILGLVVLALLVLLIAALRTHLSYLFPPGWWRW